MKPTLFLLALATTTTTTHACITAHVYQRNCDTLSAQVSVNGAQVCSGGKNHRLCQRRNDLLHQRLRRGQVVLRERERAEGYHYRWRGGGGGAGEYGVSGS
jgi:hypothetical protein